MKTLSLFFTSLFLAGAAQAANIAIKNDTGAPQRLVVYQDGKVAGYVDRLKPGKTLLVKVNDAGGKPLLSLKVAGEDEFLFLPLKTKAYKLSWLRNLLW
ncbi:hypothetical protein OKA05_18465 [Luteolibacter arcticus]|uniref:Uncharacterized protein n=1 Tax=Luteolibacter arcticus TaxID=1581411 RepID=A0ABT3GM17_9BACT|nr:hypothetical protein [Luteolibacter arcticus]MCW1924556.1 hypothetical protein [Luteolibacter arcticus]